MINSYAAQLQPISYSWLITDTTPAAKQYTDLTWQSDEGRHRHVCCFRFFHVYHGSVASIFSHTKTDFSGKYFFFKIQCLLYIHWYFTLDKRIMYDESSLDGLFSPLIDYVLGL